MLEETLRAVRRGFLKLGALLLPPFVPGWGGPQPLPTPHPSAACRRTLSERHVMGTRGAARAGPAQTFSKCNLGIPWKAGTQGCRGGGGA